MIKISQALDELRRVYDEFGDVGLEMLDTMDMEMHQPVTHVRFDYDRQRVTLLSDR